MSRLDRNLYQTINRIIEPVLRSLVRTPLRPLITAAPTAGVGLA